MSDLTRTGLTKAQHALLDYIKRYLGKHDGVAPSFDEMREALGYANKRRIFDLLAALEERGHIVRLPRRARAVRLAEPKLSDLPELTALTSLQLDLLAYRIKAEKAARVALEATQHMGRAA